MIFSSKNAKSYSCIKKKTPILYVYGLLQAGTNHYATVVSDFDKTYPFYEKKGIKDRINQETMKGSNEYQLN